MKIAQDEALVALRTLHKRYVRSCGARFRDVPFSARTVPGWTYDPKADVVHESPLRRSGKIPG